MTTFHKPHVGLDAKTLDGQWYLSPDVFARERETLFARGWSCVGREEQLASAGDYFLAEVAGESIILTRDEKQTVRAYFNVCRHRGTRLCSQPQGRFVGAIQCPYHAWTYGLDGSLRAARNMEDVLGFARSDYSLHSVRTSLYDGFIFVSLTDDSAAFDDTYADLLHRFDDWNVTGLRVARSMHYEVRCNWKLVFENYSECYHCPLVHPQLDKLSPSDSGRNDLSEGPILGGYPDLREAGLSLTTTGHSTRPPLGSVNGDNLRRVYYYTVFPSLLLSLHPDYVMFHRITPIAPDRTAIVCQWLFDPQTIAQTSFDPTDAVEFWDLTNRQDWHVNELTQRGIESRAYVPGPYANQEGLLAAFDRYYLDCMR